MRIAAPSLVLLIACGLLPASVLAQLHDGTVAVVAYNTSGKDEFAWFAYKTVPANTVISFTDASVSNGWFRWTEHLGDSVATRGPLRWSCTNPLPAGTVIRWQAGATTNWSVGEAAGGRLDLSSDGDQIIAYQGEIVETVGSPSSWRGDPRDATMLFALDFANNGWGLVTNQPTCTSMVPPGLSTNGLTAVYVGRKDNGFYYGVTTGTVAQLRAAIADPVNWVTSSTESDPTQWVSGFSVSNVEGGTTFTIR